MPKVHLISKTNNNIIQHKNINKYNYGCIKYSNHGLYSIKQFGKYNKSIQLLFKQAEKVGIINKNQFNMLKYDSIRYRETTRHPGVLIKYNDKYIIVHQTSQPIYENKENFFIGQYEYIDGNGELKIKHVFLCWKAYYIQCKNNNDFKEIFWPLNNSPYQYTQFLGNEKIRKDFNVKVNQFIQEGKIDLKEAKDVTNYLYPKDWFFQEIFYILYQTHGDQIFNSEFEKVKELNNFLDDPNKYYFEYFKNKNEIPRLTEE